MGKRALRGSLSLALCESIPSLGTADESRVWWEVDRQHTPYFSTPQATALQSPKHASINLSIYRHTFAREGNNYKEKQAKMAKKGESH